MSTPGNGSFRVLASALKRMPHGGSHAIQQAIPPRPATESSGFHDTLQNFRAETGQLQQFQSCPSKNVVMIDCGVRLEEWMGKDTPSTARTVRALVRTFLTSKWSVRHRSSTGPRAARICARNQITDPSTTAATIGCFGNIVRPIKMS